MKTKLIKTLSIVFTLVILTSGKSFSGDNTKKAQIEWISFEEAVKRNKTAPKKILIDVYTKWCGWCKYMDANTYEHTDIINYIKENYYAVKLDAEQKEPINFNGKQFIYKPEYKAHEIALSLLNNKMGYPTTIFMDENYAIVTPMAGYVDAKSMEPMLKFVGTNAYKQQKWEDYQKTFKSTITITEAPKDGPKH